MRKSTLRISHFECPTHGPFPAAGPLHLYDDNTKWWYAECPECDTHSPELPNMAPLRTAKRTGPKTVKGRAQAAANLAKAQRTGPKSPEAKRKCGMNAWRTGRHSTRTPLAPAKPGKFPECSECDHFAPCKLEVQEARGTGRPVYCHRFTEHYLRYISAHLTNDPEKLRVIAAAQQAKHLTIMDRAFVQIHQDGVMIDLPIFGINESAHEVGTTPDGTPIFHNLRKTEQVGTQPIQHPNLTTWHRMAMEAGFRLTDWELTPKSAQESEDPQGYLDPQEETDIEHLLAQRNQQLQDMAESITRANERFANDPVLLDLDEEQ
jgi:hypothetical protein